MSPSGRAPSWMLLGALVAVGCLDDLKEPYPVVQLLKPDTAFVVEAGHSLELAIQALDVQQRGVNGAHIAFTRADAELLSFDAADDPTTDAVTTLSATATLAGVQADGVASVRVVAANDAEAGPTSVVAVVRVPTADDESAVSLRIEVTIEAPRRPDAGASPAEETGGATAGGDGGTAS